jgi:hypothetical protein
MTSVVGLHPLHRIATQPSRGLKRQSSAEFPILTIPVDPNDPVNPRSHAYLPTHDLLEHLRVD